MDYSPHNYEPSGSIKDRDFMNRWQTIGYWKITTHHKVSQAVTS